MGPTGSLSEADGSCGLLSLLVNSALGFATWDAEMRCIWSNAALERYDGISRERRLGHRPREALAGNSAELEVVMRQVLATGACAIGHEYRVPTSKGNRALSACFVRLEDTEDRPIGVCLLVLGAGDRRRSNDRLNVVSEAGAYIGTTLNVMRTAQELADFMVPLFADYVTIDLTESVRLGEEPLARLGLSYGRIPTFRRAGRASIHTDIPESLWATGEVVYVPEASPFMQVMSSGRSLLEPSLDASRDTWLDNDPARAEKIREFGMHSLLILPIHARGVLLGVAVCVRTENPKPFDEGDQQLAEELVARAALSLDNARRYTRERLAALTLQRSLLPRQVHGGDAMEVAARYLPADTEYSVGGDWFDVIGLSDGRLALVVGDVVGHGINAAATMGQLRTAIRTLADLDLPPGDLLTRLDRTFLRLIEDEGANEQETHSTAGPKGATCVYAVYDPVGQTCTLAVAGHPPPAILHTNGNVTFPEITPGTPLGVGMMPYESSQIALPAGSLIALYSDGLVEDRQNDIDVGMERVKHALAQPADSLDDLCTLVINTLPSKAPADDVTLLLARGFRVD